MAVEGMSLTHEEHAGARGTRQILRKPGGAIVPQSEEDGNRLSENDLTKARSIYASGSPRATVSGF